MASPFGEIGHRFADRAAAAGEHQVNGGTALTASVAPPPLVASPAGEHAHRWRTPGLGVLIVGAAPHPSAPVGPGWAEEVVGERLEINGREECIAVEHDSRRHGSAAK